MSGIIDRIAVLVGTWALRHLYGECSTDVRDDFPGDVTVQCIGCDATRVIRSMNGLFA